MKIIGGLILIFLGTLMVFKAEGLLRNFGRISWFEKHLGVEGGTRLGYKLMGILVIFFGLLLATGTFDGFIETLLSPLIR
jgi:hypothetical protein